MTHEEKAKELIEKFKPVCYVEWQYGGDEMTNEEAAEAAAIIAVEEIIKVVDSALHYAFENPDEKQFWNQVLTELKK